MAPRSHIRAPGAVFALAAICLAVGVAAAADADFDYFYLVRQWPATFCNDHSCTHSPPTSFKFTIHGLWPQRTDGSWPEYCDRGSRFNIVYLLDLLPRLARNWPSWAGPNRGFWAHEWTRHGTCAEGVIGGERAFFKAVLNLHGSLVIEDALRGAGIAPSGDAYDGAALHAALKQGLGTAHNIFCDQRGNLAEVWSCIDLKLRPFDCGQQAGAGGGRGNGTLVAAAAPRGGGAPGNSMCGRTVRIPPLPRRRRGGDHGGRGGGGGWLAGAGGVAAGAAALAGAAGVFVAVALAARRAAARGQARDGGASRLGAPLLSAA